MGERRPAAGRFFFLYVFVRACLTCGCRREIMSVMGQCFVRPLLVTLTLEGKKGKTVSGDAFGFV